MPAMVNRQTDEQKIFEKNHKHKFNFKDVNDEAFQQQEGQENLIQKGPVKFEDESVYEG